ncbi:hypothetical protein HC928_03120 [bacterium]|nr:hypothetical protein [bacterium]
MSEKGMGRILASGDRFDCSDESAPPMRAVQWRSALNQSPSGEQVEAGLGVGFSEETELDRLHLA